MAEEMRVREGYRGTSGMAGPCGHCAAGPLGCEASRGTPGATEAPMDGEAWLYILLALARPLCWRTRLP